MLFGLSKDTVKKMTAFLKQYPEIEKILIYGSRARGDYKKGSDIDLAFFAVSDINLSCRLSWGLDELATPYLFNVVDYHKLKNAELKKEIDKHGQIFYIKPKQF